MEPLTDLKKSFQTTVLVCSAVFVSLFIYAVIVEILKSRLGFFSGLAPVSETRTLLFVFYGLAIAAVILIRFVNLSLTKKKAADSPQMTLQQLSRAAVITAVVAEIPALLGFVLFLLTGSSKNFYYLLFASLILEFIFFPRLRTWKEILEHQFPGESI
jgi:F0F1-type ATP synthase membrane subunit c/vacuolar-type H+-ATPase subunit K